MVRDRTYEERENSDKLPRAAVGESRWTVHHRRCANYAEATLPVNSTRLNH